MKSWDIKIAGEPYVFGGSPGITLGKAPTEPGNDGQIDTVVIESLHGGIGHPQPNGVLRYKEARYADLSAPRFMLPRYEILDGGSSSDASAGVVYPRFSHFPNETVVHIISGGMRWQVNAESGLLSDATAGSFDGSGFYYNANPVFGGSTSGIICATGSRNIVYFIKHANILTYAPRSAEAFRTEHTGTSFIPGPPVSPPDPPNDDLEIYDIQGYGFDENFPSRYSEFPQEATALVPDPGGIYLDGVSWMTMIGPMVVVFTNQGEILGANESGVFTVAGRLPEMPGFTRTGVGAAPWQDGLLVPSGAGLFYFNPTTLELRRWGLNFIQTEVEERLSGAITGVGSSGDYAFVGVNTPDGARAYMIVPYEKMIGVHDITPAVSAANVIITDFFVSTIPDDQTTLLLYIEYNTVTHAFTVKRTLLNLPSDGYNEDLAAGGYPGLAPSAEVDIYPMAGPDQTGSMTKRWMAMRGQWDKGSGDARLVFSDMTVDGSAIADVSIDADGGFAIPFTDAESEHSLLGRNIGFTIKLVNPTHDTKLIFPLMLDFEWAPDTTDAMQINVLVSGEVKGNVASEWMQGPWGTTEHLLSLQGQTVEIELPYAGTQPGGFDETTVWNCLVRKVVIDDTPGPDGHGPRARVAKIDIRRIS